MFRKLLFVLAAVAALGVAGMPSTASAHGGCRGGGFYGGGYGGYHRAYYGGYGGYGYGTRGSVVRSYYGPAYGGWGYGYPGYYGRGVGIAIGF
jgi:hypothetical protein